MKNNLYYNIETDNDQLLKIIDDKIKKSRPISVIRKSDGENVVLGYLNIKGIKTIKYFKKMRHFNINFLNFSFQKILRKELLESFYEADFVGVPIQEYYHGYTSSVRKFEMSITHYFNFDVRKYVDNHFQLEFVKNPENNKLKNEYAQKLISNKKIGLISHFKLDDFLADHNSTVVAQTKIPKRDLRDKKNKMNIAKYLKVKEYIKKNNHKVDVWFLAAGVYAKPFANYIKKCKGAAIDLGSVVDTWNNEYHSRKFLRDNNWDNK